jgi:hypothetical protein
VTAVDKRLKLGLIVAAVAVAGYFAWKWWQNYQASQPGGGQLGTNLNSIAPELVGGSQGPDVQPAFNVPVNITVTSSAPAPETPDSGDQMISANPVNTYGNSQNALTAQSDAAGMVNGSQMPSDMVTVNGN